MIHKKQRVSKTTRQVACKYVHKPHLLNGYKYDLRIYVLVTSMDPLKIYIYHNGLVRFATAKYTCSKKAIKKRFIHLTNYSIQKKSSNYVKNTGDASPEKDKNLDDGEDDVATKWDLYSLREKFKELGINYDEIHKKIKDTIIKTIMSVES